MDTTPFEDLAKSGNNSLNLLRRIQTSLENVLLSIKQENPPVTVNVETPELLQAIKDIKIPQMPEIPKVIFPKTEKIEFPKPLPFPKSFNIDTLPPVVISNLKELQTLISNLQLTTLKAMEALKVKFPDSFKISNEVSINEFGSLLDGIEELKKGFNILIKTTQEARGTSTADPMKVEVVKGLITPPVTHVSLNSIQGFVKSTAVTVTSALTPLPGEVLSNRRSMIIYNNGSQTMEIGGSTFTFGTGLPVPASSYSPPIDSGSRLIVYGRVSSGSVDARILESSDIASGS